VSIKKLPNGKILECRCLRDTCGLLKEPVKIDAEDADKMWLPVRYINFIEEASYLDMEVAKTRELKAEFPARLDAARKYIKDLMASKSNPPPTDEQASGAKA